ncbi:hypothetical protein ACTXG7_16185 [Mycolicibacterium sp. Dal123E01]|uniref:hypothetical protein n=1 Tax=Mycolicibacterium sp. Dal123E01 TaxID=3457578 RepID=UPI00403EA8E7
MRRHGRWLAALSIVAAMAVVPVGVAQADCDTPGDFGAGSGCPPPGSDSSGGGGTESWPPTSVDWPPKFDSADSEKSKAAPIVMPDGMTSPVQAQSSAPAPPPIVLPGN